MNSTSLALGRDTVSNHAARAVQSHPHRHSSGTIALHWFSAGAMLVALVSIWTRDFFENDALRTALMGLHRQAGLAVLMTLALRLALRWRDGLANHAGPLPLAVRLAAQAAHLALYAILLALPLLGLAASQAHAVSVRLLGVLPLPTLVRPDAELADHLSDLHMLSAWVLVALVAAHIGAALWHHLVRRDGVLVAMLPVLARKRRAVAADPSRAPALALTHQGSAAR
jgi:cytochrome b561